MSSAGSSTLPARAKESCDSSRSGASTSLSVTSRSKPEQSKRLVDRSRLGRVVDVLDRRDEAGAEGPAVGQLDEPESVAALDDDVEPAVLEAREHLDDACPRPEVAKPVVVGVDQTELSVLLEALVDELLVPLLEDVERELLGREQDDAERKQSELVHHSSAERDPASRGLSLAGIPEGVRWRGRVPCIPQRSLTPEAYACDGVRQRARDRARSS